MSRPARSCDHCHSRTRIWTRMSFSGRDVCSLSCARSLRDAERKAAYDAQDLNPVVCRCEGPPRSLESHGVHCRACRRMFSAQVRLWLATESPSDGRIDRLRLGYEQLVRRILDRGNRISAAV